MDDFYSDQSYEESSGFSDIRDSLDLYRSSHLYSNNASWTSSSISSSSSSSRLTPDFKDSREEIMQVSSIVCPVCLEAFDFSHMKPLILPKCGHTVCICCLKRIIKASQMIKCPVCRKTNPTDLTRLPVNYALLEFSQPKKTVYLCDVHGHELVGYCADEHQVLCGVCVIEHKDHVIYDLGDQQVLEITEKRKQDLENEEAQLVALQNTWQQTLESLEIMNRNIEKLKSSHSKAFRLCEKKIIEKIRAGSGECVKQLEQIENRSDIKEIEEQIDEVLRSIEGEIERIKQRNTTFDKLSIFEKLTRAKIFKTNISVPDLGPLYKIVLKLKAEVKYKQAIKRHQIGWD